MPAAIKLASSLPLFSGAALFPPFSRNYLQSPKFEAQAKCRLQTAGSSKGKGKTAPDWHTYEHFSAPAGSGGSVLRISPFNRKKSALLVQAH
jgi:hypothetical protein